MRTIAECYKKQFECLDEMISILRKSLADPSCNVNEVNNEIKEICKDFCDGWMYEYNQDMLEYENEIYHKMEEDYSSMIKSLNKEEYDETLKKYQGNEESFKIEWMDKKRDNYPKEAYAYYEKAPYNEYLYCRLNDCDCHDIEFDSKEGMKTALDELEELRKELQETFDHDRDLIFKQNIKES